MVQIVSVLSAAPRDLLTVLSQVREEEVGSVGLGQAAGLHPSRTLDDASWSC